MQLREGLPMRLYNGLLGLMALTLIAAPAVAAQTAASKECSAQADAKGLHGADRDAFRTSCMKAAGGTTTTTSSSATTTKAATTAPAATTTAKPATTTKAASSDASKACSAQADAKGLHGADRDKFRTACMKGGAPAAAAPMAAAPAATTTTAKTTSTKAAPSDMSKSCSAQADAKGLHGTDRDKFRTACMKGAAPAVTAAPAAKAAPSVAAAAPVAATPMAKPAATAAAAPAVATASGGKPLTPAQEASNARMKDCGGQWTAAKNAGHIPAGQTWPQYWSECSKRMKASGK
jgi:hypothetical protein